MVRVWDGDNAVFLFNLIAEASDNISNHFYFSLWILTQRERLSKQYMETDCIFPNLKFWDHLETSSNMRIRSCAKAGEKLLHTAEHVSVHVLRCSPRSTLVPLPSCFPHSLITEQASFPLMDVFDWWLCMRTLHWYKEGGRHSGEQIKYKNIQNKTETRL